MSDVHEGATEDWSPIREMPALPEADGNGYWEVIWNGEAEEFPSLAELFEWLVTDREDIIAANKTVQLLWRTDH